MAHQRQNIRKAIIAQLVAANTAAGAKVFATKRTPWRKGDLPGISVYTLREPVDPESARTAPRELERNLQVKIEGALQLAEGIDDALDALADQIERAVDRDETFGGTASDAVLTDTVLVIDPEAEQPVGSVVLTYTVTYYTRPSDALDPATVADLKTVDVKTRLGGTADPAEDKLEGLDQP